MVDVRGDAHATTRHEPRRTHARSSLAGGPGTANRTAHAAVLVVRQKSDALEPARRIAHPEAYERRGNRRTLRGAAVAGAWGAGSHSAAKDDEECGADHCHESQERETAPKHVRLLTNSGTSCAPRGKRRDRMSPTGAPREMGRARFSASRTRGASLHAPPKSPTRFRARPSIAWTVPLASATR
jgi:hypothetical protein